MSNTLKVLAVAEEVNAGKLASRPKNAGAKAVANDGVNDGSANDVGAGIEYVVMGLAEGPWEKDEGQVVREALQEAGIGVGVVKTMRYGVRRENHQS